MNKVLVAVIGVQRDDAGEETRIEWTAAGSHYQKGALHYVTYRESGAAGMADTATLLKIGADSLTLVRRGAVRQEQVFRRGEACAGDYLTPYGKLALAVRTEKLDVRFGPAGGAVEIAYDLMVGGRWQSANELYIKVSAGYGNKEIH